MGRTIAVLAAVMLIIATSRTERPAQAIERAKAGITFEAVVEKLESDAITLKAYHHVVPPSGTSGGAVHSGNVPAGAKAARFERLPVMPEAKLQDKKLRSGARVNVTLDTLKGGALVVIGLEERTDPERIGVDWLDAPKRR
ncbi:MAG: hypothetical protein U0791_05010 [Gemmataceae bacterium]